MSIHGIQPLDLQTEPIDRNQYPRLRFLLVVAAIISSLLIVSWAAHRNDLSAAAAGLAATDRLGDPQLQAQEEHPRIPRDVIARAIPLRP